MDALAWEDTHSHLARREDSPSIPAPDRPGTLRMIDPTAGQSMEGAIDGAIDQETGDGLVMPPGLQATFADTLRRRRARARAFPGALSLSPRLDGVAGRILGAQATLQVIDPMPRVSTRRAIAPRGRRTGSGAQASRDRDVLMLACRAAATWPDDMRVLIALGDHLTPRADFARDLREILDGDSVAAGRIDLAIPECGLQTDDPDLPVVLAAMRDLGIGIYWSGFGGATSSLTLLRELADGGLISGVELDAGVLCAHALQWCDGAGTVQDMPAVGFFSAEIAAIRALGLRTRLVGVDRPAALAFARAIGFDELSGTLAAPAQTEAEFAAAISGVVPSERPAPRRRARREPAGASSRA